MTEHVEDADLRAEWCPWCRRAIPILDPHTMEPAAADYTGALMVIHDDVYHPANLEERPN